MQSAQSDGGVRAYPLQEGFDRLGVKAVKGYALLKSGELKTFTIGSRRYVTEEELQRFINARLAAAMDDSAANRARKVQRAVEGRRSRREALAA